MTTSPWRMQDRVTLKPEESPEQLGQRVRQCLETAKLVHITGVDPERVDLESFYDAVTGAMGVPFATDEDSLSGSKTGGRWISIRYDERYPDRYRHAKAGQPLHTDMAYTAQAPDVPLLYCVNQAPGGGETIFIDAVHVASALQAQEPALHEELLHTPIRFYKAELCDEQTVLAYDESGPRLNWLYTCVDRNQPAAAVALAERFHAFVENQLSRDPRVVEIALHPGEAAAWRDSRLLHGRRAFDAEQRDDRHLRKTAIFLESV